MQCKNASRPAEKNAKLSTRSKIGKVPAKEKHAAPLLPGALDTDFASFLAGDQRAGAALYERLKGPLLSHVRRRAPDLPYEVGGLNGSTQHFILEEKEGV